MPNLKKTEGDYIMEKNYARAGIIIMRSGLSMQLIWPQNRSWLLLEKLAEARYCGLHALKQT